MARRFPTLSRSAVRADPAPAASPWLRLAVRQGAALLLLAGIILVFRGPLAAIDLAAVGMAFGQIAPEGWLGALAATYLSFRALGRYDAAVHRLMRTGTGPEEAARAGAAAIAISQAMGAGLVTGALVRWRLSARLTPGQAARVTAGVTGLFLLSWLVVASGAVLLFAPRDGVLASPAAEVAAGVGLVAGVSGVLFLILARAPVILGRRIGPLPGPLMLGRLLALTLADTGAAGLALWFLLPPGLASDPAGAIAAYLVALGAALVLATPGGVGPFETVLFLAYPGADPAALMASVLAFRAVYVALPALFAMAVLIRGPMRDAASSPPALLEAQEIARGPGLGPALFSAGRAECGILRQGQHGLLRAGATAAAVGRGRISLVALFDPLGPPGAVPGLLSVLAQEAAKEGRLPGLYKCGPHTAALARRAGWTVLRIAEEQVLDPRGAAGFAGPAYASLRRKLRRAEREGVTVEEAGAILPLPEMTAIARDWDMARGPERGFSMGRFDPDYVAGQRVFLARRDGRPIAFASFHEARAEWTLDLMRWSGGVPDGTMQSLVAGAVAAAAREGVPRLSLAALPCRRTAARIEAGLARLPLPPAIVTRLLGALGGAEGLRQFKVAFAPRPVPLYLAAPGRTALVLAALDIAAEIHRPRRLPGADPCRRGRRQCGQRRGSV